MANSQEAVTIIVAGATGDLGARITAALLARGARVWALVRVGSTSTRIADLRQQGATIVEVDYGNASELAAACAGGACVVSALSGLADVMVDVQTALLDAAVAAGVPRFIPSDFAIDFTKLPPGTNRNLDFRRAFGERLDQAPIAATSVLNGMFADLLTGQAPVVLAAIKRVVYWGDADQLLDFITIDNTAAFTAAAALDPTTPRYLRIAGEVASAATGNEYRLLRVGGLDLLDVMIKITRTLIPQNDEVFPPWQGMQYLRNMFSGVVKLTPLDNNRYPEIQWTSVRDVLTPANGTASA